MSFKQKQGDVFEDIKTYDDNEFHTIFCDPPYQLGTKWTIGKDGQPKTVGKGKDFMSKWDGMTEKEFDIFFKEAFRVTKHGGYVCMFGMYRQIMALTYYATKHGFEIVEPYHLYFLSSFPKASDLSKNIDKRMGTVNIVGKGKAGKTALGQSSGYNKTNNPHEFDITKPSSKEAEIFDGYKYSIAPLKQVLETCFILKKPNRDSVIDDALNCLKGDKEVSVSALNIDGGRVATSDKWNGKDLTSKDTNMDIFNGGKGLNDCSSNTHNLGRFPSNLMVDESMAKVLDEQSGVLTSGGGDKRGKKENSKDSFFVNINGSDNFKDTKSSKGGSSKILHKFTFEENEHDLINYAKKVQKKERNAGLDDFEDKNDIRVNAPRKSEDEKFKTTMKNNHPTLKSVQSIEKLFTLFSLSKECNQKIYIPFSGVNSEVIGVMKAIQKVTNCSPDEALNKITTCEYSDEYIEIGKARLDYWKTHEYGVKNKIVEIDTETEKDFEF